jgi:hypothetical protein
MSRITTPTPESVSRATAEIYAQIRKAAGGVPNTFAAIGAYRPAALKDRRDDLHQHFQSYQRHRSRLSRGGVTAASRSEASKVQHRLGRTVMI